MADDDKTFEALIMSGHGSERRWARLGLDGINDGDLDEALRREHTVRPSEEFPDREEHLLIVRGRRVTVIIGPPDEKIRRKVEQYGVFLDDTDDVVITAWPGWDEGR